MRESRAVETIDVDPCSPLEQLEVIEEIRSGFLSAPWEDVVQRHLAAMLVTSEAARHLSDRTRRTRRRRVAVFATTAAMGAGLLAGGAAAATGSLPGPAQRAVAGIVEPFGVDLPDGHREDAPGRDGPSPDPSDQDPETDGAAVPTTSPPTPSESGRSDTAPGHADTTDNAPTTTPGYEPSGRVAPIVPPGLVDGTGPAEIPPAPPSSTPGRGVSEDARIEHGPATTLPDAATSNPGR